MMINVQLEVDGPITELPEADLVKRTITVDDENEHTVATEYRLASDPRTERAVHRSVNMTLKQGIFAEGVVASLG